MSLYTKGQNTMKLSISTSKKHQDNNQLHGRHDGGTEMFREATRDTWETAIVRTMKKQVMSAPIFNSKQETLGK
jgi:hypothetical protein